MPKKQKQSKQIPGEEKAPGFSLGDFMTLAPPRGQKKNVTSGVLDDSFPKLGDLEQTLPLAESNAGCSTMMTTTTTSTCWGSKTLTPSGNSVTVAKATKELSDDVDRNEKKTEELPYTIGKTKKGSLPIRVENRNKGKKVTVVFNVSGNLKELLSELKHAAGSGGVVKDDTVEIQGDKAEFVEKFLKNKLKKKCI